MNEDARTWVAAWLRQGDEASARALMAHYYPFVAALIQRHMPDPNGREDMALRTFTRFFSKADRWDATKPLEPWLARIAINLCRDHYRSIQCRPELRWSDLSDAEREAFDATLANAESTPEALPDDSRCLLLRLLDTLNADDRMVVSLLYLDQKSTEEIAAITGWSRVLVKVRAFRARHKLRTALEKLERHPTS